MIVVTGGAGFIGSNVLAALEERGEGPLVCCDWLGSEGKWRNIAKRRLVDIIAPEELDGFISANFTAITAIYHLGAISETTATDGDLIVERNFTFSKMLWNHCARLEIPFLYASSAATYGDGEAGFDDDASPEALEKLRPRNLYGWTKHAFDLTVARQSL